MALQTLNTIQSGVQSSYSDKYIKQALSNLGQRTGTRGDSIINQDFKITDIKNYNVNLNDVDYICIAYNPLSGDMECIYNDNVLQADHSNMFASLDITDIVEVNNVPIVEYIGDWNDLNNVRIYKNHTNNSYFVSGVCLNNGVATEIIALEFDENTNTLLNGLSLVVDNNFVSFIIGQTIDGNIQIKDNVKFQIQNSNNLTFNTLYTDVAKFVSVNDIVDYITDVFKSGKKYKPAKEFAPCDSERKGNCFFVAEEGKQAAIIDTKSGAWVGGGEIPDSADMHWAIYKKREDVKFIRHTKNDFVVAMSRKGKTMKPLLDDFAQLCGPVVKCATFNPSSTLKTSKKVAKALGNKNAVLVKDNGAVCVAGNQYDAEAVELVMEKAAKTAVGAELYADVKPLSALDSNLMRIIYKLKYSKKAGK